MGWHFKIMFTVVAMLCVVVGLVGLILPIIPGLLFLIVAVLLLARVSPKLARWVRRRPAMNRAQNRFDAMGQMNWGERIGLCFWMAMSGILQVAVITGSTLSHCARHIRSRSSSTH
jgi:hypothetical protein|tara:strand:- start:2665 stop:3012 length:348 start_codon:yes stop_codon:yes gene_type:complete